MNDLNKELILILSFFSDKNFKRLQDFIQSPYFYREQKLKQSQTQLLTLLAFIQNENNNHQKLNRKNACQAIFPNELFDQADLKLSRVMSELLHLTKQFIYWENIKEKEKNDFTESFALLQFYIEKREDEYIKKTHSITQKDLEHEFPYKNEQFFYHQFLLESSINEYYSLFGIQKGNSNFDDAMYSLDYFYAILSLSNYTFQLDKSKVALQDSSRKSYSFPFINTIQQLVTEKKLNNPHLTVFNKIAQLLLQQIPERILICDLEENLEKFSKDFKETQLLDFCAFVRNFWGLRYTFYQDYESLKDYFEIYKKHWKNGSPDNLWQRNGTISPNIIQNAVDKALKLHAQSSLNNEETEYSLWVKQVLQQIKKENILKKDGEQTDVIDLCWANYYLHFKEYEKAEKAALYQKYKNPYRASIAAFILIEVYYYSQPDKFDDTLQNFRTWLTRQEIPTDKKDYIREQLSKKLKGFKGK